MKRSDFNPTGESVDFPRHPRTGTVVSVRLDAAEALTLHRVARDRQTTISGVARDAIATYLRRAPALIDVYRPPVTSATGARAHPSTDATTGAEQTIVVVMVKAS